jgi:hypothetical protein
MSFNFVADRIVAGKAYPALTTWSAEPYTEEWREFGSHWPYTIPCNLLDHCAEHRFPYNLYTVDSYPERSLYPIALQFFDFGIDYFGVIDPTVLEQIRLQKLTIMFYYDEGDNPHLIKNRLDQLCCDHNLKDSCYKFVTANTAASSIPGFVCLQSDELLFWQRNLYVPATPVHCNPRSKEFTVLSRTHKLWRATVMADLKRQGLLDNSYWSYRTDVAVTEDPKIDNPIELVSKIIKSDLDKFLKNAPYACDTLTSDQHNNHGITEIEHFQNSYCSVILETHFDANGSNGAFLTEKTFKAIKHGHPFVIIGTPGSLNTLRLLGYRTFDHAIDNSYDLELDNVQRWIKIVDTITKIKNQDIHKWFLQCVDDITHNQQLFSRSKYQTLNILHKALTND